MRVFRKYKEWTAHPPLLGCDLQIGVELKQKEMKLYLFSNSYSDVKSAPFWQSQ
jgi:hypothetical protein